MTDKLVEQIKADREEGTPGFWQVFTPDEYEGPHTYPGPGVENKNGEAVVWYADRPETGLKKDVDAKRIARVPEMEVRIIHDAKVIEAAKKLATIFENCIDEMMSGYHDQFDGVWTQADFEEIEHPYREALCAFNAALEEKDTTNDQ